LTVSDLGFKESVHTGCYADLESNWYLEQTCAFCCDISLYRNLVNFFSLSKLLQCLFIHSFIHHYEHFYSAPSRRLLQSVPDSSMAKKESF